MYVDITGRVDYYFNSICVLCIRSAGIVIMAVLRDSPRWIGFTYFMEIRPISYTFHVPLVFICIINIAGFHRFPDSLTAANDWQIKKIPNTCRSPVGLLSDVIVLISLMILHDSKKNVQDRRTGEQTAV